MEKLRIIFIQLLEIPLKIYKNIGYISKMVNVFSLLYEYTDNNNGSVAL